MTGPHPDLTDTADCFLGWVVEQAKRAEPRHAIRKLIGAREQMQKRGWLTSERSRRITEELRGVINRAVDKRRN